MSIIASILFESITLQSLSICFLDEFNLNSYMKINTLTTTMLIGIVATLLLF